MSEEEKINQSKDGDEQSSQNKSVNAEQSITEDEIAINTLQPATSEIKAMEVHHHPHVEKKNFKEYFLEFLMIFLAVSMGFIAENIREHFANNETEKRNMQLIVSNLKDDVTQLQFVITSNEVRIKILDTLLSFQHINNPDTLRSQAFYNVAFRREGTNYFMPNNAAVDQMKSSGSLRLIKSDTVLKSIFAYGYAYEVMKVNQNYCEIFGLKAIENASKFIDFQQSFSSVMPSVFPQHIPKSGTDHSEKIKDDVLLEYFNNALQLRVVLSGWYLDQLHDALGQAEALISLIQKEYHLENE